MKFRPCCPDADADPAIRRAVQRLLAACDIVRPPTPIEAVLERRKLTSSDEIDRSAAVRYALRKTGARLWDKLRGKVAGILDLRERHIAVDPALHVHRRKFLRFHEVGHDTLAWHRELFVVTSEADLKSTVRARFEAEANSFAGHAIFQNDHMAHGYRGKPLHIADLAGVAAEYRASLSATAHQYVAIQDLPTALVIGSPHGDSGARGVRFTQAIANNAFLLEFGHRLLDDGFPCDHPASALLNHSGTPTTETEILVPDLRGEERVLLAETIYNSYCTLTLLHVRAKRQRVFGWRPFHGLANVKVSERNA